MTAVYIHESVHFIFFQIIYSFNTCIGIFMVAMQTSHI